MYQRDGKMEAHFDKYVYADIYPSVFGLVLVPKPSVRFFLNFVVLRETFTKTLWGNSNLWQH
jgi:hypothetical protein